MSSETSNPFVGEQASRRPHREDNGYPRQPVFSSDSHAWQVKQILAVAERSLTESAVDEVTNSWLRCANDHRVDPADHAPPQILAASEIKAHREPLDELVFTARGEIDHLYAMVRVAGYALLFCDMSGSIVEHRGQQVEASQFAYWGTWLGGVWSESIEGTNGIGTCITEQRPVTIHRGQHYRARHKDLSCSGAPVFGVDGSMVAVLDVSAIDPNLSERAHGLTGTLTMAVARAIEERYFREHFRQEWIVLIGIEESAAAVLLAVDGNQRIVGANRGARRLFVLDQGGLQAGVSLWRLFERDAALFRRGFDGDIVAHLIVAGSDQKYAAIVTAPSGRQSPESAARHTHPRFAMLATLPEAVAQPVRARGGLPSGAMRRVHEYMDAHISENIDLPVLATVAGVSVYHFAREFKRSTGVTPHNYLVRKRVERAKDMLARTDFSLTEIALATGFADQSHLARNFRQMVSLTPGQFRWSQR
jgi:transcriptional regulator of acetoin/glycerol metabolism